MFNNIYAATYKYYSKFKYEEPRFSAVCLLTVYQILLTFFVFVLLRKFTEVDFFGLFPNKYFFLPLFFVWFYIVYRYYDKERSAEVVSKFEQKTIANRKVWGYTTLTLYVLPLILIAAMLTK